MIISIIDGQRVVTSCIARAEIVGKFWKNYPTILKQAGDRLASDQRHGTYVVLGKDYGGYARKGEKISCGIR